MKALFSYPTPFFLAHGGAQTLTEGIMSGLAQVGVEVEPERWWDDRQKGDILHYVARCQTINVQLAHAKGMKVVMTDLLDQVASRPRSKLFTQRLMIRMAKRFLPGGMLMKLNWDIYKELDAMVFCAGHEWDVAQYLFDATPGRGYFIGHGVDNDALEELARPEKEGDYLVSVATIAPRKNSVLLAQCAHKAKTPILFLGKPYTTADPYFQEFMKLVDNKTVRYAGFVDEREKRRLLRAAKGFVLLSHFESGCIAVYEAGAAGLPLLLSDLPWARHGYPEATALRFVNFNSAEAIIPALKSFYAESHRHDAPTFLVQTWKDVGRQYLAIYEKILAGKER